MIKLMMMIGLNLSIVIPAVAGRILDADGKEIGDDSPPAVMVPQDAELYERQKRSAAVMDNLVNQNPEYQEGHAGATVTRQARQSRRVYSGPPRVIQMRIPR